MPFPDVEVGGRRIDPFFNITSRANSPKPMRCSRALALSPALLIESNPDEFIRLVSKTIGSRLDGLKTPDDFVRVRSSLWHP